MLKTEIDTDPLGRGYSGMSNQGVADSLNALDRTRIRAQMSGDEIFQQTNGAEFAGLADDAKRQMWVSFCARDVVDPGAAANVAFVQWIFGVGPTLTALNTAREESISRATELGFGVIGEGAVWDVRNG